ncbi:MAG: hypothetical protein AABZ31_04875, partial [Bdellovibrionota bacterium]
WADRVYLSSKGRGMVILKAALEVNPKLEDQKIYAAGDDFLVHIKNPDGKTMNALYFSGYSEKAVRNTIEKETALVPGDRTGKSLREFFSLSVAHASNITVCSNNLAANVAFAQNENSLPLTVLNSVIGCLGGLVSGAWNATGGAVVTGAKGVFKAVTSPVQTFRDIKNSVSQMKQFIANFSTEMQKIGTSFAGLPAEIKSKIICEAGSTLGVGLMVGMLTGGTGAALALKGIHGVVSKVAKLFPNNAKLKSLEFETSSMKNASMEARTLIWGGMSAWMRQYNEVNKAIDTSMIYMGAGLKAKDAKLGQIGLESYLELLKRKDDIFKSLPGDATVTAVRTGGLAATGCTSIASLKKQLDQKMTTLKIYIDKQSGADSSQQSQESAR